VSGVRVRSHRRRWPRSSERTAFDWRAFMRALRQRQKLDAAITEVDRCGDTDAGLRLRRQRVRVTAAMLPKAAAREAMAALARTPDRAEELDELCAMLDAQTEGGL
jgi:hypothetical protein